MATLDAERAQLGREMAGIDVMLKGGGASVDELERALIRRAALELRTRAVDAGIAAERAKAAQEAAQARAQEAARLEAVAAQKLAGLIVPLVDAHAAAQAAAEARRAALDFTGSPIPSNPAAGIVQMLERILWATWPGRFTHTTGGFVDKGR